MYTYFSYKITVIGLLFLFKFNIGSSQPVTRQYIDSALLLTDSTYKTNKGVFYVINGIPYDSLQLDTIQNRYNLKHLVEMQFLSCEKTGFHHCNNDIAIVLFAYHQKNKFKRKAWKASRQLFDNRDAKPILLIDKLTIDPLVSEETFNALKLKDIMYIDTTMKDGQHQVRIWKS